MKKLTLIAALLCMTVTAYSQESSEGRESLAPKVEPKGKTTTSQATQTFQRDPQNVSPLVKEHKFTTSPQTAAPQSALDYPKFVDTGNPEQDKADFERRKKEWYEKNGQATDTRPGAAAREPQRISNK